MALGGRGGRRGRGWPCLLGWTPALLLFNTQTQHPQLQQFQLCCNSTHKPGTISYNSVPALLLFNTQTQHPQLQLNSSSAAIQHTNPAPSATTQFQPCCYSTHKPNTLSYNSVPALLLFNTQTQHPQLQLSSSSAAIQHTNPTPSATTQFQEADSTPGLCYTAHKANTVCYNSIPESRLHPRPVLYGTQSQHCPLQLNSRKQTVPQACVIRHTNPTLSATTQLPSPGSRLHPRPVLYGTQSQHCLPQLNSRKLTAPQACVIQHTKPTLSTTTQFQTACLSCRFWMHSTRSGSALV